MRRRTLVRVMLAALVVGVFSAGALLTGSSGRARSALLSNPELDPGTSLSRPAPNFTLTDQSGRRVSLRSYRGRVVILAFIDARCTTVCPLTTTAMLDAKRLLGAAGARVALLGIDANPDATAIRYTRAYTYVHGMLGRWKFLTGSRAQLKRVWRAYGIGVEIAAGNIDHTPALYVIDTHGTLRRLYLTQMSYASIAQQGQLLAREAASLLPGHPLPRSHISYAAVPATPPSASLRARRVGGGSVRLGPDGGPRLYLFFDSWDADTLPGFARDLDSLNAYARDARARGLPPLTAIDEASVEPSAHAAASFLQHLRTPLAYPVAADRSGRLADGYEVQDEPWLVLASAHGRILWYDDVSVNGWPARSWLAGQLRAALGHGPRESASRAARAIELAGSRPALAALHRQSGALLGSTKALLRRLAQLRGYPVVVNAWASWCGPCQQEFSLLASASVRYGRTVAFLGVDTDDSAGDGAAFLAKHPVSYPSYRGTIGQLSALAQIPGLPTTIFIGRSGKVVHVHLGQYDTQSSLDADIQSYLRAGGT